MTLIRPQSGTLLPRAVAVRADSSVFITDTLNHRVWVLDGATRVLAAAAGTGVAQFSGDGGDATLARLREPWALAVDEPRGRLLICDTNNHRLRAVSFATGIIYTLVGTGAAASSGDGGAATSAAINAPRGVVAAADGAIFIAEGQGHVLRRMSPGGTMATIAGTGARGFAAGPTIASAAALSGPGHLALGPGGGSLFIADTDNFALRVLTLSTGVLTTLAGNGSKGWTPDGAIASSGSLTRVLGLAVDGEGVAYFSDSGYGVLDANGGNNCVRAVDPSGALRTVAGRCNVFPHAYLEGVAATDTVLDEPCGLALAPGSRRLHISDYGHRAVLLVTLAAPPTPAATRSKPPAASRSRSAPATRSRSAARTASRSAARTASRSITRSRTRKAKV